MFLHILLLYCSGRFLGLAHNACNLLMVERKQIFGMCHNFQGYDSHILMQAISRRSKFDHLGDAENCHNYYFDKGDEEVEAMPTKIVKLGAIPLNTERFKCLEINNTVMVDSLAFLNDSLERLVQTLNASGHSYPIMKQWIADTDKRSLLLMKGI